MSVTFLNNKYTIWYNSIIINAQIRDLSPDEYYERHHIIPKSLGGNNQKTNLVKLTAREHFICHWLLTKMVRGLDYYKMLFALGNMQRSSLEMQRVLTSWQYELCRKAISVARRNRIGNPSSKKGKKYGKQQNPCKESLAKWWTDGTSEVKAHYCPEGWSSGRLTKKWWTNGNSNKLAMLSPGEGWTPGRSDIKNKPQSPEHKFKRLQSLREFYVKAKI